MVQGIADEAISEFHNPFLHGLKLATFRLGPVPPYAKAVRVYQGGSDQVTTTRITSQPLNIISECKFCHVVHICTTAIIVGSLVRGDESYTAILHTKSLLGQVVLMCNNYNSNIGIS